MTDKDIYRTIWVILGCVLIYIFLAHDLSNIPQ